MSDTKTTDAWGGAEPDPAVLQSSQPRLGHRKISAALSTFTVGSVIGVDLLVWLWDGLAQVTAYWQISLPPMPETVAQNLVTLISFLVFYRTREDVT